MSACSRRSRTRRRSCCGTPRCSPRRRARATRFEAVNEIARGRLLDARSDAARPRDRQPARARRAVRSLCRAALRHRAPPRRARGRARRPHEPGARRRRPRLGATRRASIPPRSCRTAPSTSPTWRRGRSRRVAPGGARHGEHGRRPGRARRRDPRRDRRRRPPRRARSARSRSGCSRPSATTSASRSRTRRCSRGCRNRTCSSTRRRTGSCARRSCARSARWRRAWRTTSTTCSARSSGRAQLLRTHDARTPRPTAELAIIERAALDGAATVRRLQEFTRVRTDRDVPDRRARRRWSRTASRSRAAAGATRPSAPASQYDVTTDLAPRARRRRPARRSCARC